MINFEDVTKENTKEHNPHWQQIHDHLYRMLLIRDREREIHYLI